jgi:hypothetical protein
MPREKRAKNRTLTGKDRRIASNSGMGRIMRSTSVKMFVAQRIMRKPRASAQVPKDFYQAANSNC